MTDGELSSTSSADWLRRFYLGIDGGHVDVDVADDELTFEFSFPRVDATTRGSRCDD